MAEKCTHLIRPSFQVREQRSKSEGQKAKLKKRAPHRTSVSLTSRSLCSLQGLSQYFCGTKQLQSANWWETQWCGNCFCVSISPSRLPYSGKLNFRRRKLSHEFRGFVAIRESFLREILGLGVLWRGKREQSAKVFSFFHQFAKVFSLDSFPLYGIPRGGIVNRETKRNGRHTHKFAVCLKCTAIEVGYSVT